MKYKSLTQIEIVTIVDSKNRNVKENFVTSLQARTKRQLCIHIFKGNILKLKGLSLLLIYTPQKNN